MFENENFVPQSVLTDYAKQEMVKNLIADFDIKERVAFRHVYNENMTVAQTAQVMGLTEADVEAYLNHAKGEIKNLLGTSEEENKVSLYALAGLPLIAAAIGQGLVGAAVTGGAAGTAAAVGGAIGGQGAAVGAGVAGSVQGMGATGAVGGAVGAQSAAAVGTAAGNAAAFTTGAAAKGGFAAFIATTGGKVAIGVAATALVAGGVGGTIAAVNSNNNANTYVPQAVVEEATETQTEEPAEAAVEEAEPEVVTDYDAFMETFFAANDYTVILGKYGTIWENYENGYDGSTRDNYYSLEYKYEIQDDGTYEFLDTATLSGGYSGYNENYWLSPDFSSYTGVSWADHLADDLDSWAISRDWYEESNMVVTDVEVLTAGTVETTGYEVYLEAYDDEGVMTAQLDVLLNADHEMTQYTYNDIEDGYTNYHYYSYGVGEEPYALLEALSDPSTFDGDPLYFNLVVGGSVVDTEELYVSDSADDEEYTFGWSTPEGFSHTLYIDPEGTTVYENGVNDDIDNNFYLLAE